MEPFDFEAARNMLGNSAKKKKYQQDRDPRKFRPAERRHLAPRLRRRSAAKGVAAPIDRPPMEGPSTVESNGATRRPIRPYPDAPLRTKVAATAADLAPTSATSDWSPIGISGRSADPAKGRFPRRIQVFHARPRSHTHTHTHTHPIRSSTLLSSIPTSKHLLRSVETNFHGGRINEATPVPTLFSAFKMSNRVRMRRC